MTVRLAVLFVTICLCTLDVSAQPAKAEQPRELSRQQKQLLAALVDATDRAPSTPPDDHAWLTHVLRASDGSHYVAFSVTPPAPALTDKPIILYVRLATAAGRGETITAERSTVREWLAGSRSDPRLLPRKGGVAIGDMPPMGAGAIGARGAPSVGSADLQAIDLQRERQRQRAEEDEKKRRATLEGSGGAVSDRLPFEDFEIAPAAAFADGTRAIQRALTAGPGSYDLSVAWADVSEPAAKANIRLARRRLQLGPAGGAEFGLSSVIVAERVGLRQAPYDSLAQRAHPYAIGLTEIMPARNTVFTPARALSVAFQIFNASPSAEGKPDVRVEMRLVRLVGAREEPVAALSPLAYNATTLPPDFDLRLGHPVIAAMSAPLATVPRGSYRLMIAAEDKLGGAIAAGDARFTVVGTPQSLLAEAPGLAPRFDRAVVLAAPTLTAVLDRLSPDGPSAALARPLQSARTGRFGDLLIEESVPPAEQPVRVALTGLALMSLGDLGSVAHFERALQLQASASAREKSGELRRDLAGAPSGREGGPEAAIQFLLGAARAMQNRDRDAIAAWQAARSAGFNLPIVDRLIAEAYLRQREFARAADAISSDRAADAASARTYAATRIAASQIDAAVAALDPMLARDPADAETRWLLLHALYADYVGGNRSRAERVAAEASRYIDAKGPHSALASEWLAVVRQ